MKRIIQLIAVLLVLTISTTTICADSAYDRFKNGSGYVAIGDSYTRGYGASDNFKSEVNLNDSTENKNCRNVTGSFPKLICDELGLYSPNNILDTSAKYWPLNHDGVTTAYILDLLGIDDGFCDSEYLHSNVSGLGNKYKTDLTYFGDKQSYAYGGTTRYNKDGSICSAKKLIKDASLITIELGASDVFLRPYELYLEHVDYSDTNLLNQALKDFTNSMNESISYWKGAYRKLIEYINEENPDCTVVIVGIMNPVQDIVAYDNSAISIGSLFNLTFDVMNSYYRSIANEFGYIFVDISNVETLASEGCITIKEVLENKDMQTLYGHPSKNGYAQIARMIVSALKDSNQTTCKTDIKVDVGRFDKVDYVSINGIKTNDYTLSNNVLTIKNKSKLCKTLTIAVVKDSKTLAVTNYSLTYKDGYIVKKINTTNSVLGGVTSIASKCITSIKKLFK